MLFVAPAARLETLWDELCQRAGVNGPLAETSEEFRSVTMAGARHLMLTSWTHLLERLDGAGDEHTMIAVQQLRGLTSQRPMARWSVNRWNSQLGSPQQRPSWQPGLEHPTVEHSRNQNAERVSTHS